MYAARIDANGVVEQVVVVAQLDHAEQFFGTGTWIPVNKELNYCSAGWWWDGSRFWPWKVPQAEGTIWVTVQVWEGIPDTDREAFLDLTGLLSTYVDGLVVLGGRVITDSDLAALVEVIG